MHQPTHEFRWVGPDVVDAHHRDRTGLLIDPDGTQVDTTAAVDAIWRATADLGVVFSMLASFIHGSPADQTLATAAGSSIPSPGTAP